MSRDVITIEPFDTIGYAAEKMVAEGVSAIVVSDGGGSSESSPSETSHVRSPAVCIRARPASASG